MKQFLASARPIFVDSMGVIAFAALIAVGVDRLVATAIGASLAVGLILWHWWARRPIGALQWLSLGLVALSAGATFLSGDPRFMMAKPTVSYAIAGAVMLRRGWMLPYLPASARDAVARAGTNIVDIFGYIWAGLMFLSAAANLGIAVLHAAWWPLFIAVFPPGSKILLFTVQFIVMKIVVRARIVALSAKAAQDIRSPVAASNT